MDFILALEARYERLEGRVEKLEAQLRRSSRNSSLPPSQDPPSAPPPGKPSSDRSRGGQPGHEGRHRPLLPLERVDELLEHWPERCQACAHPFGEGERLDAAAVQRHQVAELPPIVVTVSEHRLHRLRCPVCAAQTRAELPAGVPSAAFGPRLQAAVATLVVRNRVSRRDTVELVSELFGLELSTGSVEAIVQRTGEALAEPQARLHEQIRSAPAVNVDETGWRLRGGKRTLWAALSSRAALFRIAPDRHEREAKALLGEDFRGIACSDRWWAYDYLEPERRQLCWAHLVRDFTAHSEGLGVQKAFGQAGLAIAARLFEAWQDYQRDGDRARLRERVSPLKDELRTLLEHAARKSTKTKYHRPVRQQPAQALAGPVDLHPPRRRRADQQPRRARPTRRRHLPQALARQSIRAGRAHRRAAPVSLTHLPPPETLSLRLSHRRPHRQDSRRSHPPARLIEWGT